MKTLKIDRDGWIILEGQPLQESDQGLEFLTQLFYSEGGVLQTKWGEETLIVHPFDQPIIALNIEKQADEKVWRLKGRYGFEASFALDHLKVDDWDRFHGRTPEGIPFVMSPKAQDLFFEQVDRFDDEGFFVNGRRFNTPFWLNPLNQETHQPFWASHYQDKNWPWDLAKAHPAIESTLAQIKLNKQRVLVLGCGRGHDAALLASKGHIVTAIDFEERAIQEAKQLYPEAKVHWVVKDIFSISQDWFESFDLIFEHTCYCAIDPYRRSELVKLWKQLLSPRGHLLAIFFAMDKEVGPPFGGSEWEIYKRIKPHFEPRYWTRWEHSVGKRKEKELVVYAEKR